MGATAVKVKSFLKHRPPWSHILLAILLTSIGVVLLPADKSGEEARRAIGGAFLATGLVGILYDYLFVRRVIGNYFELLKAAASLELDRLYADRSEALEDITAELQKAHGDVKIASVSGSDFFGQGRAAKAIADLVKQKHNVHLRFLLLQSKSRYAFLRAWIEEQYGVAQEHQNTLDEGELAPNYSRSDFNGSTMKARIDTARAALNGLENALRDPTKLSVRFYKYQPSLFLVAVNRWVFVEPYHWGVDRDYSADPVAPFIAKRVPILKFKRTSFSGTVFENHFDRLWRCKRNERFLPKESGTVADGEGNPLAKRAYPS